MIIDRILDIKDAGRTTATEDDIRYMKDQARFFGFGELARALGCGVEADIRRELCAYIDTQGYSPSIKDFINKVEWIH